LEKKKINNCTLYLGEAEEILEDIKHVDAIITDPPYGIKAGAQFLNMSIRNENGKRVNKWYGRNKVKRLESYEDVKISDSLLTKIIELSDYQIIWGGNYYNLPLTGGWLVWDKDVYMPSLSKGELAWTNFLTHLEIIHFPWAGFRRGSNSNQIIERYHPNQKPVELMKRCIQILPGINQIKYKSPKGERPQRILDPFMGSGSTLVAGLEYDDIEFIGIEKEKKYFDMAVKRIEKGLVVLSNEPLFL
jgi:site-specific DNA-methyltransferase (adenine-specific)/modification methylase